MEKINEILQYTLIQFENIAIQVVDVILIGFFFFLMRLLLSVIRKAIVRFIPARNKSAENRKAAILQIVSYVVYVIFLLLSLEFVGVNLSLLIAGAAALLVGLGFGLQQIFNDLISGLIILFEGNVNTGDIVDVDGRIGRVELIGLRASTIKTHENSTFVVPNSMLVSDLVHSYSHSNFMTRFKVTVGVAYGSDLELVSRLLVKVANEHQKVNADPLPFVRFIDFGNSSLDFELHFWTDHIWGIEDIQSDIRFGIDAQFRQHGVTIPFPQRDLHIMSSKVPLV